MFELPEVETVRRELDRDLVGMKVKAAEAKSMQVLGRYRMRKAFTSQLLDRKILGVYRCGLYITILLNNDRTLVINLGSSGSLRRNANKDKVLPHTEITITFTQYGQLRLLDPEGTAEVFVIDTEALVDEIPAVADYGMDMVERSVAWTEFGTLLLSKKVKLKALLTDDSFVVGIGNIYADEILFEAGLRHDRLSSDLSRQEVRRLHRALVGTLHDAIKYRGTSLPDRVFVDPLGVEGVYADHLAVWGKHKQLSRRNRRPIKRSKFRGEWTYYCESQV